MRPKRRYWLSGPNNGRVCEPGSRSALARFPLVFWEQNLSRYNVFPNLSSERYPGKVNSGTLTAGIQATKVAQIGRQVRQSLPSSLLIRCACFFRTLLTMKAHGITIKDL